MNSFCIRQITMVVFVFTSSLSSIAVISVTDQLEDYCFLPPESISLDEIVIIKAGGTVSPKPIGNQCKITVLTENKYDLQVSIRIINFRSCAVILTLYATTNVSSQRTK